MGTKRTPGTTGLTIFALLLVFLPSQLGYHFWPEWAYINGVRIDYFSPTLYFTDILVLLLFLWEIFNLKFKIFNKIPIKQFSILVLTALFALVNTYLSSSPAVTLYKWLKVAEMAFLAYWVAKRFRHSEPRPWLAVMLVIAMSYSAVLAVWQFVNQGSVGGLWYWLGERTFTRDTPGIANAVINGQLVLRPYATFPHPNVLAGFLVVSSLVVLKFFPHISRKITALVLATVILTLFLTPSRGDLLKGWNLRQQLNNMAIEQWVKSPIVGTGLGTSPLYPRNITNFALLHQPIHNIYLLVLSETGAIGFMGLMGLISYMWVKNKNRVLLGLILFLGFFDHYWLTLQQGQLLLAVVIGIILGICPSQKRLPGTPSPR